MDEKLEAKPKKRLALLTIGLIFLLVSLFCGAFCLIEMIDAIIRGNTLELALMILVLISYGLIGIFSGIIGLILNGISYKKAENMKIGKLIILGISLLAFLMNISSFVIWIIAAN